MSYPTFVTPVSCKYGAPMGRRTGPYYLDHEAGKVHLRRIQLDSGGYDKGGAYWGIGSPLYEVIDQEGNGFILRAFNRSDAKKQILKDFPDVKFFR